MNATDNQRGELQKIAARYAAFGAEEARGLSGTYEALACGVAGSRDLLAFVASLPPDRRQPNLFLAAVRHVRGVPESVDHLMQVVREDHARIRKVMLAHNANAIWISNEVPSVYPWVAASAPPPPSESRHLMSINGSPLAWTGPHGQSIDWFGSVAIPR